ncbi:hypothetical protein [Saccharibacillus brassicae]|nr:hypothetical protein [Saccharibacillus brassicae]
MRQVQKKEAGGPGAFRFFFAVLIARRWRTSLLAGDFPMELLQKSLLAK